MTLQNAAHLDGREVALDVLVPQVSSGLAALLHHLDTGEPLDGPMSVEVGRTGQILVDAARTQRPYGTTGQGHSERPSVVLRGQAFATV